MSNAQFRAAGWFQVPPPAIAPIDQSAEELLLVPGLRAERRSSQFRCASCDKMSPNGSWLVWVPDSVRKGDPAWSVSESCRQGAFNGSGSGWCLKCAQPFSAVTVPPLPQGAGGRLSWWARLWSVLKAKP